MPDAGGLPLATSMKLPAPALTIALCLLVISNSAFAYIDPNAGGMLFQLLAPVFAALVGGWIFLRRWLVDLARRTWRRLTGQSGE